MNDFPSRLLHCQFYSISLVLLSFPRFYSINTTHITDGPRFPHRGLMIDTARRFYPVATILTVMDGMEASKLNVLHCDNTSNLRHSLISRGYLWIRGLLRTLAIQLYPSWLSKESPT